MEGFALVVAAAALAVAFVAFACARVALADDVEVRREVEYLCSRIDGMDNRVDSAEDKLDRIAGAFEEDEDEDE